MLRMNATAALTVECWRSTHLRHDQIEPRIDQVLDQGTWRTVVHVEVLPDGSGSHVWLMPRYGMAGCYSVAAGTRAYVRRRCA